MESIKDSAVKVFRFDDVCINSDMELLNSLTDYLKENFNPCDIIWAISPLVKDSEKKSQRVYPKEWNAASDFRCHYFLNGAGIPPLRHDIIIGTHGLIHCDHRLLTKEVQELSIFLSTNLINENVKYFVPPFNKWNKHTEKICEEFGIELIKYEDGWFSCEHNDYNSSQNLWYLHAREWTVEKIKEWFDGNSG